MATKGGSAGSTGYSYQDWFITFKLVDAFFDENIKIQPEAQFLNEAFVDKNGNIINSIKEVIVDDVIIYQNNIPTYYNIKYIAPSLDKWSVSSLYNKGVITQIVKQSKSIKKGKIVFVSQSPCNLFKNVFGRIKKSPNVAGVKLLLGSKNNEKEYREFKKYSKLTDSGILKLSKIVEFELGYDFHEYKKIITRNLKNKITRGNEVANSLYQLTKEASNNNKVIGKKDIISWLENDGINIKSRLNSSEIIKNFKNISSSLITWKNTFGNISDSHIQRSETSKILAWLEKPSTNNESSILLVVGDAGSGKTVILKDVITQLQERNIAAVALKSDLYSVESMSELNIKLNTSDDFEKLITTLASKRKTVLLIDQIDALSQTLSSERGPISFYYNLINSLSFVPNLQIVVSCRTYDLSFDPILQQLDVKEKINVGNLSKEQIETVINKLELKISDLPQKLVDIIGNTQNLNIFTSIYDEKLVLDELKSLEDLYSELWDRKILKYHSQTNNIIDLLSEISEDMYNTQKISVNRDYYNDKYSNQLNNLISEGILILTDKKRLIQFFHQSFFDYCFARTFVNSGENLYEHILKQHQGLFVRSLIKQVMSYLRGANIREYLSQLELFIKSNKIRFHIKQMLINQLGFEENPIDGEWKILKKYILNQTFLTRQFLEANRSCEWFDKLEKQGLVNKYITSKNKSIANSCALMFYTITDVKPQPILRYMLKAPEFENKSIIISNILFRLKDWSSSDSIQLFEKIKDKNERDYEFRLEHMLSKTIDYHLDWSVKILNEYINKRTDQYILNKNESISYELFDYHIERVFEKLYKKYPDLYFQIVFPIIKKLAHGTKFDYEKKFFIDSAFLSYGTMELHYSHWQLCDWLKEYIQNIALNSKNKFLELIKHVKNEKSISILNLIVSGFLVNPKIYKNKIYDLLLRNNFLKDFRLDVMMSYNVNELIEKTYSFLTISKKEKFNKAILLSESEKLSKGENKHWKGNKIYGLLGSIPNNERINFPEAQKKYLELERKFGKYKKRKPEKSTSSIVGPPLPQIAYDKMTFNQWLESFKEYDDSTSWDRKFSNKRGFNFGGLIQHSRMFGAKVKENPDKFYPFILKVLNEEISSNYLSEALSGLVEANYDIGKVSLLIKELNKKGNEIASSIIKGIEYLGNQNGIDEEIINILCDYALNNPDPQKETWQIEASGGQPYYGGDALTAGLNTIRGSAAFALVKIRDINQYKEKIFETLERIAKDKSIGVKCITIANLNLLIHLDSERVFKIFIEFTKDLNKEVLRSGLRTFSYYIKNKYPSLKKHIGQALKISGSRGHHSAQHFMGQLLMYLYVNGVRGSKKLFEEALENNAERKAGALHYSIPNLHASKQSIRTKAQKIFKDLLTSNNETIQNEYWRAFREFNSSNFLELYDLILAYSQVKGHRRRDNESLYRYLQLCVNDEPEKCLIILENMINNYSKNNDEFALNEKPVKLLIAAYNKLNEYSIENEYADKAMNIFDKMIKNSSFKYDAYKVLQASDYS